MGADLTPLLPRAEKEEPRAWTLSGQDTVGGLAGQGGEREEADEKERETDQRLGGRDMEKETEGRRKQKNEKTPPCSFEDQFEEPSGQPSPASPVLSSGHPLSHSAFSLPPG